MSKLVLLSAFLAACTSDHLSSSSAALTGGCSYGGYGCGSDLGSGSGSAGSGSGSGSDCYDLDATTTSSARLVSAFTECTYGGCGSNVGSGSDAPPDPPHSTISITYDPGNPTSQNPGPAQTGMHCSIPQDVLATLPIYSGKPAMKSCTLDTYMSGSPPNTVSTYLNCTNGTGQSGYDYFACESTATFIPPSGSTTGYFSYGKPGGGTPDIAADTCRAWIARAVGICKQTGVQAE